MEVDAARKALSDVRQDLEDITSATLYNSWAIGALNDLLPAQEIEQLQRMFEERAIALSNERYEHKLFHLADTLPMLREGMQALVDVSTMLFRKCK
jgi:hypothetical protein